MLGVMVDVGFEIGDEGTVDPVKNDYDWHFNKSDEDSHCVEIDCPSCGSAQMDHDLQVKLGRLIGEIVETPTWTEDRLATEEPAQFALPIDDATRERIIENVLGYLANPENDSIADLMRGVRCVLEAVSHYDGVTARAIEQEIIEHFRRDEEPDDKS
jgi:hypothetical protein